MRIEKAIVCSAEKQTGTSCVDEFDEEEEEDDEK